MSLRSEKRHTNISAIPTNDSKESSDTRENESIVWIDWRKLFPQL